MSVPNPEIISHLKQYGSHCMAYTSLEPTMEYFVVEGMGYIAYTSFKHWFWSYSGYKVVLADPICAPENYQEILSQFIKKHPNVIFVEVSKTFADALHEKGLQVNQFGIETSIPLADFSLKGKYRAKLRQWQNKCKREGVVVKEVPIDKCDNLHEIKTLSDTWLKNKGGEELGLLVRPFRLNKETDVRYFWAYQNKKLIGMALFDPIYCDGEVVAYYHNIDRILPDAPHGTSVSILLDAITIFKEEGIETVQLGMSPLSLQKGLSNEFQSNFNAFTRKAFWYAFDNLNFLYPFKGNTSHKNKFNGNKKPIYFSTTKGTGLWQVFVMMKTIGMI